MRYVDRTSAGRALAPHVAEALSGVTSESSPLVLGIPRGGVIVAAAVAEHLDGDLNVALARKIGAPGNPELAIGAVAETGDAVLLSGLIAELRIGPGEVDRLAGLARRELERRLMQYRDIKPPPPVRDRTVVVVDDGVATGATLLATLQTIRSQRPAVLIGAVPVGPPDTVAELARDADVFVCPLTPRWFRSVGEWYERFTQTTDDEVLDALRVD